MKGLTAAVFVLATTFGLMQVQADNLAYLALGSGGFGTVDLNTGVFTSLGNFGQTLGGLAVANGTLYGVSYGPYSGIYGALYSINPTNGSLTLVGSSSVSYDVFGSTASGIYAVGHNDQNLYSVNSVNGAATLLGPTGLSQGSLRGLSAGGSILYYADGPNLYTLDTNTGAATLVGNMGGPEMGAMVVEGGLLYGGQDSPNILVDTLNPISGAATNGPSLTGTGGDSFWGLAPYPLTFLPSLAIGRAGDSVIVSWPSSGGWTLQQTSSLGGSPGWATSGYAVTTNTATSTSSITITPPAGNLCFRLRQPPAIAPP